MKSLKKPRLVRRIKRHPDAHVLIAAYEINHPERKRGNRLYLGELPRCDLVRILNTLRTQEEGLFDELR